ncbi:hypothetical protein GW17_00039503 [Ensete ventricosum]|nr:hypothetical protein GW17_00039503 [Ensete ventricosum]RZS07968.1 hypothetical protein BHM03_00038886 [Ensete ventricosum]
MALPPLLCRCVASPYRPPAVAIVAFLVATISPFLLCHIVTTVAPHVLPHPSQSCLPLLSPSIHAAIATIATATNTSSVPLPISLSHCPFPCPTTYFLPCILLSSCRHPDYCNLDDLILAANTDRCET